MKNLLLTGWLWYIWSHNVVLFLEAWYEVIIFDNLSNSNKETLEKIEKIAGKGKKLKFYEWDLREIWEIEKIFLENTLDWVIHFAWVKAVGESCEKAFYYYENNIVGSLNLFKIMEKYNCRKIIFSSSANIYGPNWISPFFETDQVWDTSNPYGTTKYIIERILRDLHVHNNFSVINLRYFNPIGAHESGLIGEHANQKLGNILPFLLKVANNQQECIEIFWNDYNTIDWSWVRDYIHVVDLAKWHLAWFQYLENNTSIYESINLWTGNGTSVFELLEITREVTSHAIPHKIVSRRKIDIAEAYCSSQKSHTLLWWKAEKTVREAVEDSWNFIKG